LFYTNSVAYKFFQKKNVFNNFQSYYNVVILATK
jgi:hypothetical protein